MHNIPKEVKIGNRIITVEFNDEPETRGAFGFYDPTEFRIVLSASEEHSNSTTITETFWHELMHAIFDFNRFVFDLAQEIDDKDAPIEDAFKFEEKMSEQFAKTLLQVLQDNPALIGSIEPANAQPNP